MKNSCRLWCAILSASILVPGYAAVEVVSCKNSQGQLGFYKRCPPGTTQVGSKQFRSAPASNPNAHIKATIYTIPECDSCLEVKEFLTNRKLHYEEKLVHEDIDVQEELKALSGALSAPTTLIGETVIRGYSRDKLLSALAAEGYVEPDGAEGNTAANR